MVSAGNRADDPDISAIADYNRALLDAIAAGDLEAIDRLTYENLVTIGDDRPASQGKARAMEAYAASAKRFDVAETWEPRETLLDGDIAYQHGRFSIRLRSKASGETADTDGRYFHVYRKLPGHGWTLAMIRFASERGGEMWDDARE